MSPLRISAIDRLPTEIGTGEDHKGIILGSCAQTGGDRVVNDVREGLLELEAVPDDPVVHPSGHRTPRAHSCPRPCHRGFVPVHASAAPIASRLSNPKPKRWRLPRLLASTPLPRMSTTEPQIGGAEA